MKDIFVDGAEAGIRLDKFLQKLLPYAGKPFLYKMLRKKNITLNQKKAEGSERLCTKDHIQIFFSDETYEQFRNGKNRNPSIQGDRQKTVGETGLRSYRERPVPVTVVYEDRDMIIADKPAGLLTQRAEKTDDSLNDWLCGYIRKKQQEDSAPKDRLSYTPSAVNRLDRNTSGLVLCAKTYQSARVLSRMIHDRMLGKYYLALVVGQVKTPQTRKGYLIKDPMHNRVTVSDDGIGEEIHTSYSPLLYLDKHDMTLLLVQLITGKPHQIRAHLADCSHPVCGDPKYGNARLNRELFAKYGICRQLLHAFALSFPQTAAWEEGRRIPLAGKTIVAAPPQDFRKLLQFYPTGEIIWQRGIQEDFAVPLLRI